ncbi:MAG: acyl--CoA ligase, partial [Lachnospiraceae bacterium]|nr:acyl--CoA ligase [Lachnospiraceae bacterium]
DEIQYPSKTLWQFLRDNNSDHLDEVCFLYFDKKITYRHFFKNVEATAKALESMGIRSGDIVTVMSMHTPETIYILYGLNCIGAIANNIYPTITAKELSQTLDCTESKAFFILDAVFDKYAELVSSLKIQTVLLKVDDSMPAPTRAIYRIKNKASKNFAKKIDSYSDFIRLSTNDNTFMEATDSKAPAAIIYTSGTTGEPKGVVLSNDSINHLALQHLNGLVKFSRGDTMLFILPPFIGIGMTHLHIYASLGVKLILNIVLNPKEVTRQLFKYKPYAFITGPAFIPELLTHKPRDLRNLKYFIGGGGALTEQQIEEVNHLLEKSHSSAFYCNGYGMTEACSSLAVNVFPNKSESVGLPWLDTVVKVVDPESGTECRYNEIGELWFCTPLLMEEYWKNTKATNEVIVTDERGQKWLRTGDLGIVDSEGFIYIKGRIKRIYITRGEGNLACKLFPQHIEEVLLESPNIKECGCIVRADEERINVVIAYVTLSEDCIKNQKTDKREIENKILIYAREELPAYMVPVAVRIIDRMPMTPSGKVDYRKLEAMDPAELNPLWVRDPLVREDGQKRFL